MAHHTRPQAGESGRADWLRRVPGCAPCLKQMGSACCKPKEPELTGLDAELAAQREAASRKKRILILGTGESGKSSLVKQVKQIFGVRLAKLGGQAGSQPVRQTPKRLRHSSAPARNIPHVHRLVFPLPKSVKS